MVALFSGMALAATTDRPVGFTAALVVVAAKKNVRGRHLARLLGERADERLLRLGGAEILRLFRHRIEHLFAERILKKLDARVDALEFHRRLGVVLFASELFALGVELADFAAVLAVVKVQRTGADLADARVFF